jgi:hypothetical protein
MELLFMCKSNNDKSFPYFNHVSIFINNYVSGVFTIEWSILLFNLLLLC